MKTTPTQILFISLFFLAIISSTMQAALMEAINKNNVIQVRRVLQSGACDVDGEDNDGFTALIWVASQANFKTTEVLDETAANANNFEIAKLLLSSKANVNKQGKNGGTPLTFATQFGSSTVVKLLIQNKANVNKENSAKVGPLTYAVKRCYCSQNQRENEPLNIVQMLLQDSSIKISAISEAFDPSIPKNFKSILKTGINEQMLQELQKLLETAVMKKAKKKAMLPAAAIVLLAAIIKFLPY